MTYRFSKFACAAGVALLCTAARLGQAQTCTPDPSSGNLALMQVVGSGPAHFQKTEAGCPRSGGGCDAPAYLVPGDMVVAGASSGDFTCAFFRAKGRSKETVGFLPTDRLRPSPPTAPPAAADWVGAWADGDNRIKLAQAAGGLSASGDACYPSCNPSLKDRPGGPNLGSFSGTAQPTADRLAITDKDYDGCHVGMALRGPYLVVDDNNGCGGMNVTFRGIYTRQGQAR